MENMCNIEIKYNTASMEITYENNDDWLNRCLSSMDFIGKNILKMNILWSVWYDRFL